MCVLAALVQLLEEYNQQMEESLGPNETRFHFFFFVNTKSGNREGQTLMSHRSSDLTAHLPHADQTTLTFVDLFDAQQRQSQILNLKRTAAEAQTAVRVIVCGGDGTISWVLNELVRSDVDLTACAFGVIPIGTGNDFCRTIGWPSENFDFRINSFAAQIQKWIHAELDKYDIWDVTIETYKNGKIYDIKDCKQFRREENSIKKVFSNYVGLGLDARIVYTVQKIRTRYALFNKFLYAMVGLVNFFRPMKQLKKKLLGFTECSGELGALRESENSNSWIEDELKSANTLEIERRDALSHHIRKKYRGFVCLNATSYMAGLRDMWETDSTCTATEQTRKFTSQAHNDGKIEFLAYKNELGLGLERCCRTGARLAQGAGPFEVLLKQTEQEEVTHIQIDGESLKIANLKSIRISRTDSLPGHQINVMVPPA